MKKTILLAEDRTPDGGTVTLVERDGVYTIRVNGAELMSTRAHASEEELARLVCAQAAKKSASSPRVLIGGLGFGFTLRAALSSLPHNGKVVVAELLDAVIAWNQNPTYPLAADVLADERVTLERGDVYQVLARNPDGFDGIMLDVDNGPVAMSVAGNARLYQEAGLRTAHAALRTHGCLGVWSAGDDPAFAKLMGRVGFAVEVRRTRAHTTSGGWHSLFLGTRN